MYIVTTEVSPHVRVSKTLFRVASYAQEPRAHRTERRRLNKHAAKGWAKFDPTPRLVKPEPERAFNVIDLSAFKASRPVEEVDTVLLPEGQVVEFHAAKQAAERAGL